MRNYGATRRNGGASRESGSLWLLFGIVDAEPARGEITHVKVRGREEGEGPWREMN